MAGSFPSGKEFNVEKDAIASQVAFTQWPTTILLSGVEIGRKIKVGLPLIKNEKIRNSPVKDASAFQFHLQRKIVPVERVVMRQQF